LRKQKDHGIYQEMTEKSHWNSNPSPPSLLENIFQINRCLYILTTETFILIYGTLNFPLLIRNPGLIPLAFIKIELTRKSLLVRHICKICYKLKS